MKILESKKITIFDVDDTIVKWGVTPTPDNESDFLAFKNPDNDNIWYLLPNWEEIRFLKKCKREGDVIVIWSAGGWDWVQEVVKVLNLETYVDLIMSKPNRYVDDLPCNEWMGEWRQVK